MLRTARAWGATPTVFLGQRAEDGHWSARDRELAKSLTYYEGSLCDCGLPAHETQDPDREGWYEVEKVTCAACAAAAEATEDAKPGDRFRVFLDPNYVKRS